MEFCQWALGQYDQNNDFGRNIIFSDEAIFHLNGEVNSQNFRYWSDTNPHWMEAQNYQGAEKIMVWCGIINNSIIGPFFFDGHVTGETYLQMLNTQFWPAIQNIKNQGTFMLISHSVVSRCLFWKCC